MAVALLVIVALSIAVGVLAERLRWTLRAIMTTTNNELMSTDLMRKR